MSQIVPVQPIQQINTNMNVPGGPGFLGQLGWVGQIAGTLYSAATSGDYGGMSAIAGKDLSVPLPKNYNGAMNTDPGDVGITEEEKRRRMEAGGGSSRQPDKPAPVAPAAPTGREVVKPTGTGTQLSGKGASYDEIMSFLGSHASQFVPGMQSNALPNTPAGYGQLDHGTGFTAEAVFKQNPGYEITPGSTPTKIAYDGTVKPEISLTDTGYQVPDSRQGAQSTVITADDPIAEQAFGKDWVDKYKTKEDPKNSGINWANRTAADNSSESVQRRRAVLDAPSVLEGLKARDAMYGKVYAGGQYHEIPEKGGNVEVTYEPGKVQEMMRADVGSDAQAQAQAFLADYKDSIKSGAASSQNPMLNADEDEGKGATAGLDQSATDFVENNASPTEMVPMLKDGFINGKLPAGSMPSSRIDFGGAFSNGVA